eukprot:gene17594-20989_t
MATGTSNNLAASLVSRSKLKEIHTDL